MVVDTNEMKKPYVPAIEQVGVMGMSDGDDSGTNLILRVGKWARSENNRVFRKIIGPAREK